MAVAFSAEKYRLAVAPTPVLARFGRRLLASVRRVYQAPDVGEKPRNLHVSQRAWRRNSALLMSLYEQRRP